MNEVDAVVALELRIGAGYEIDELVRRVDEQTRGKGYFLAVFFAHGFGFLFAPRQNVQPAPVLFELVALLLAELPAGGLGLARERIKLLDLGRNGLTLRADLIKSGARVEHGNRHHHALRTQPLHEIAIVVEGRIGNRVHIRALSRMREHLFEYLELVRPVEADLNPVGACPIKPRSHHLATGRRCLLEGHPGDVLDVAKPHLHIGGVIKLLL